MPEAGTYQVTLWDAETKKVLVQTNVTQLKDEESTLVSVAKTAIMANKEYRISVYNDKKAYYYVYPKGEEEVKAAKVLGGQEAKQTSMFPIVKGNITILTMYYSNTKSVYPEKEEYGIYGYPEFGIQF